MKILVSACLLGLACRYDGKSKANMAVCALAEKHALVPFCPEIYGGLPTPRTPAERRGDHVVTADGRDVTAAFCRGAAETAAIARRLGAKYAFDAMPSGVLAKQSALEQFLNGDALQPWKRREQLDKLTRADVNRRLTDKQITVTLTGLEGGITY